MTWLRAARDRYSLAINPLRAERRIELIALVLGLVLCFQLLYSGVRYAWTPVFDAVAPAEDALTVKHIHPFARVSATQSEQIRARPLFWDSRRPVEPVVVTAKAKVPKAKEVKFKDVALLGVFGGDGDGDGIAGIIIKVKGKKRRIMRGEVVDGWTLESVRPNEVVFSAGGKTESLQLLVRNDFVVAPPVTSGGTAPEGSQPAVAKESAKKAAKEVGEESLSLGGMLRK